MSPSRTNPWIAAPPLFTERLTLRGLAFGDASRLTRLADDPGVARMLTLMPQPFLRAHASALIGDMMASNDSGEGLGLAVARRATPDQMIGIVSFAREGRAAEIGWWLGRPYWGKGYATEAVAAMIEVAFREPAIDRLTAGAFADNPASLHVHDKLGFTRTRLSERNSMARGGKAAHVDMALTRERFVAGGRTGTPPAP